jgi:hypothetical protein
MQQTKMAAHLSEHTAATWAAMFHGHFLFTLVDHLGTISTISSITGGSHQQLVWINFFLTSYRVLFLDKSVGIGHN